jgi:hypothetical protein
MTDGALVLFERFADQVTRADGGPGKAQPYIQYQVRPGNCMDGARIPSLGCPRHDVEPIALPDHLSDVTIAPRGLEINHGADSEPFRSLQTTIAK